MAKRISEAPIVPKLKPPLSDDFVSKSPNVAPNGRVNTNAIQNKNMEDIFVKKCARITNTNKVLMNTAPPAKPNPELSARKSPNAVPKVFDIKIAVQ